MPGMIALIVTYHPPEAFETHLQALLSEFPKLIIVDNGSPPETRSLLQSFASRHAQAVTIQCNRQNLGVAAALNQGFRWAMERGYQYVIALDQDSTPVPGMARTLIQGYQNHPNQDKLACLSPMVVEELVPKRPKYMRRRNTVRYEWIPAEGGLLRNVTLTMTSGSLYNLEIWQKLGPFREDFFIDYVDTEYNLRAIQHGYEISVQCDAGLIHHLGERQEKKLLGKTFFPTFHSPVRWYYISRNRIAMLKRYAFQQPHWLSYELVITMYTLFCAFALENQRPKKFKALWYGTCDGLRHQMGKIPPQTLKQLS